MHASLSGDTERCMRVCLEIQRDACKSVWRNGEMHASLSGDTKRCMQVCLEIRRGASKSVWRYGEMHPSLSGETAWEHGRGAGALSEPRGGALEGSAARLAAACRPLSNRPPRRQT
eukprot:3319150-Pleurochrysis_carterae.AAC.1